MNVLAIAKEIDRGGHEPNKPANFGFFRRTSGELSKAIRRQNDSSDAILRQYLARIDDARLKRAFASAIEMDDRQAPRLRKPKHDERLWRGLAPRSNAPSNAR
jgi:Asp-tRNA(Asn)/Glu-tRNA(Gln) amidotransferase A subunit family amidase